ncbi:DNA-binding transcriptional regulator, PadR family [Propionibacterium cyclohexanicum]|uniref:DNA-binding transcriptional regulator, PadR family n=1 Tax=Propionibacterium cyclohexanicum TaxID=64702 RepID=A0A1H9PTM1_9ACTN|nr:PadR family transcriptional regulator [Propionibacterium cyclohexanicum]SER51185.1 DNA-binding transcriptional regulator, PadR family [Propionibacterium cyclohexanicum]
MRDPADRLTPLGVILLALLDENDMHPYEMKRVMLERHKDRLVPITNGTVYHTVARLEAAGLVTEVGVDREGKRPERTTYTLTRQGHDAAMDWVGRELARTDRLVEFRVALSEAHNLPRSQVIDCLETRRAAITGERRLRSDGLARARAQGVAEQFLIEIDREQRHLDTELSWLDDIIEQLDQDSFIWDAWKRPDSHDYLEQRKAVQI